MLATAFFPSKIKNISKTFAPNFLHFFFAGEWSEQKSKNEDPTVQGSWSDQVRWDRSPKSQRWEETKISRLHQYQRGTNWKKEGCCCCCYNPIYNGKCLNKSFNIYIIWTMKCINLFFSNATALKINKCNFNTYSAKHSFDKSWYFDLSFRIVKWLYVTSAMTDDFLRLHYWNKQAICKRAFNWPSDRPQLGPPWLPLGIWREFLRSLD